MLCSKTVGIEDDAGDVALTTGFRIVDADVLVCAMLCVNAVLTFGLCCVCVCCGDR